jgi:biotin-(acetyl-CoA carboxylase) ligase
MIFIMTTKLGGILIETHIQGDLGSKMPLSVLALI